MNERIFELAEQADEYADAKLQMPGEYHPDWHDVRDEKFAELIVRESIDVLEHRYKWDGDADGTEVKKCIAKIKQHFGVE